MADDLLDLAILGRVGVSAAPADAVDDVRSRVHWISRCPGGRGAVREFLEVVLGAQGKWDRVLHTFLGR
jgi:3-deoxy-D-manno-octulosonate 8-phosphate phosphatase (KDO 8-P phosphatase)